MTRHHYKSPVGILEIKTDDMAVTGLDILKKIPPILQTSTNPLTKETCKQLDEYFAGKRKKFDLPLAPEGTPFQQAAWRQLQQIPYGQTISYSQEAKAVGHPKACRAVGSANGKNPIAIIIPCHRVIAANGGLGGYASGLENKIKLLDLEKSVIAREAK